MVHGRSGFILAHYDGIIWLLLVLAFLFVHFYVLSSRFSLIVFYYILFFVESAFGMQYGILEGELKLSMNL